MEVTKDSCGEGFSWSFKYVSNNLKLSERTPAALLFRENLFMSEIYSQRYVFTEKLFILFMTGYVFTG